MPSFIPAVKGSIKIEVITDGEVVKKHETPNTLVLEAPKIMLGNLIAPHITGNNLASFTNTDVNRPTISSGGTHGVNPNLAVTYLQLGYVEDPDPVQNVVVSANDSSLGATLTVTKSLTDIELGEYSLQFICSFEVTNATADRNYFEAALLCPALNPIVVVGPAPPDPSDAQSGFDSSHQVMFAHQTHTAIQASSGSTIRYTWTITMQEPTDA